MQEAFELAYRDLNTAQKQAVDKIDGPLMVIAGPGTGKTQLLSTRAAQIVRSGNANPSNILCLTYTEAGASEMRERLGRIMGPSGGEVAVHTFHSFGSSVIHQYPEYFVTERALEPLDDLGRFRIFERLLAALPLRHPLAVRGDNEQFVRRHAVEEAVSAFKEAGYVPDELRALHKQNQKELADLQPLITDIFSSTLSAKRLPEISTALDQYASKVEENSLGASLIRSLGEAVTASEELGKTKPIGAWRDSHTVIKDGARIFKSAAQADLLSDTITLYERYQESLKLAGRFDYEDMILWVTKAFNDSADLLLDVAERYQYIMVDEYQDTNGAQNRLLDTLLQANPLNSPNVMVVGDDDQAIMRFQGAELSGMARFVHTYEPSVIVLTDNYRSGQLIVDAARQVMSLSHDRLELLLPDLHLEKQLLAQKEPEKTVVEHRSFASPSLEYASVASYVKQLISEGIPAKQIAVIGRKHAELEQFVAFLAAEGLKTNYDRQANVLDEPALDDLLRLARLIVALNNNPGRADTLLPEVLTAEYWGLPPLSIYHIAGLARQSKQRWIETMLTSDNQSWKAIAEWLVAAAERCHTSNFTQCLELLIGRQPISGTTLEFSPFGSQLQIDSPVYSRLLSHLIALRAAVLSARPTAHGISDLIEVANEYRLSGLRLIDNNPILRGDAEGVQVLSAHGAKGREFEHVIILSAVDNVWGSKARGQSQRIRLPENLPLYPAGDTDSDRLRLLYVAMTRAKSHLLLTSYSATDDGRAVTPLSYIQFGENGWWQAEHQANQPENSLQILETSWRPHAAQSARQLGDVIQPLLKNYRLSASALRSFIDIRYGGPQAAVESSVFRFPSAYNAHSALGSATHKVMEAAFESYTRGNPLSSEAVLKVFDSTLDSSGLSDTELEPVRAHGHQFLPKFVEQFSTSDFARITGSETFLTADLPNVKVPISGAVDATASTEKGIEVIDYKTGQPPKNGWDTKGLTDGKKTSLHFYRQQLMFYKLLLENSPANDAPVTCAELIFAEPPENENTTDIIRLRIDDFEQAELQRTEQLIKVVYDRITRGELPDISGYSKDLKGIKAFEEDLLSSI